MDSLTHCSQIALATKRVTSVATIVNRTFLNAEPASTHELRNVILPKSLQWGPMTDHDRLVVRVLRVLPSAHSFAYASR